MKTDKSAKNDFVIGHPNIIQTLPHHSGIPFTREVYFGTEAINVDDLHIAVHHVIDAENVSHGYAEPHNHNVQELNIVIGLERDKPLKYRFIIENETHFIESPASIVIPAGITHAAIAMEGSGIFICIIRKSNLP